jgi:membrane fusion protein, multidrug efflux system
VKRAVSKASLTLVSLLVSAPVLADEKVYASHLMVDQEVVVSARITGIVESISVDRGATVREGQVLAMLDPREFDAEVRRTKEDMDLKKVELDRAQSLAASKVMSAQDLDQKRAEYQVAVATWQKAKAIRDYAVVRAPFAGVVTEKYARLGQKVIEDKNEPLFKITAVEPLLARVYLPEEELLRVKVGDRVEVVPDRFPGVKTTGAVRFVSPTVDAASGTFQVVILVHRAPSQPALRPGVAVKIRFIEGRSR